MKRGSTEKKGSAKDKLKKLGWNKSFDQIVGEEGAWEETVNESHKILQPVFEKHKQWREKSRRSAVSLG